MVVSATRAFFFLLFIFGRAVLNLLSVGWNSALCASLTRRRLEAFFTLLKGALGGLGATFGLGLALGRSPVITTFILAAGAPFLRSRTKLLHRFLSLACLRKSLPIHIYYSTQMC